MTNQHPSNANSFKPVSKIAVQVFYCGRKSYNHRKCQKAHSGIVSSRQGLGQARTLARRLYKKEKTINSLFEINCLSYILFTIFFFWRGHVGIEPTRDFFFKPHTGFEDQETHQSPFCPQNHSDHTLMQFFLLDPGLFHQADDLRPVLKSGAPCQSAAGRDHPRNRDQSSRNFCIFTRFFHRHRVCRCVKCHDQF